jgi:hypothetical protein
MLGTSAAVEVQLVSQHLASMVVAQLLLGFRPEMCVLQGTIASLGVLLQLSAWQALSAKLLATLLSLTAKIARQATFVHQMGRLCQLSSA